VFLAKESALKWMVKLLFLVLMTGFGNISGFISINSGLITTFSLNTKRMLDGFELALSTALSKATIGDSTSLSPPEGDCIEAQLKRTRLKKIVYLFI
jgi:hypothetical protein